MPKPNRAGPPFIYVLHLRTYIVDTAAINPAGGPYRLTVTAEPV
jgi:hypothetical protein